MADSLIPPHVHESSLPSIKRDMKLIKFKSNNWFFRFKPLYRNTCESVYNHAQITIKKRNRSVSPSTTRLWFIRELRSRPFSRALQIKYNHVTHKTKNKTTNSSSYPPQTPEKKRKKKKIRNCKSQNLRKRVWNREQITVKSLYHVASISTRWPWFISVV